MQGAEMKADLSPWFTLARARMHINLVLMAVRENHFLRISLQHWCQLSIPLNN